MTVSERFIKAFLRLEEVKIITSRQEIASKLGYKPSTFTEILKGRTEPSSKLLQNFCLMFKVSPQWILMGIGDMFHSENGDLNEVNKVSFVSEYQEPYLKECLKCREKDAIIKLLKEIIESQKLNIELLKKQKP